MLKKINVAVFIDIQANKKMLVICCVLLWFSWSCLGPSWCRLDYNTRLATSPSHPPLPPLLPLHSPPTPHRTVLISLTSVVLLVISTDWISWDNLNRGFLPSDEVSRAFLASFILVFDLLIVMQVGRRCLAPARPIKMGRKKKKLSQTPKNEGTSLGLLLLLTPCQCPLSFYLPNLLRAPSLLHYCAVEHREECLITLSWRRHVHAALLRTWKLLFADLHLVALGPSIPPSFILSLHPSAAALCHQLALLSSLPC